MSYIPHPEKAEDIVLDDELLILQEKIAENVHETWAEGRIAEGWKYGETVDSVKKTTPWLVPYNELPESEKNYDRNTAMRTLKYILKMGYSITKNQ